MTSRCVADEAAQRIIDQLTRNGASVSPYLFIPKRPGLSIMIDDSWRGEDADLLKIAGAPEIIGLRAMEIRLTETALKSLHPNLKAVVLYKVDCEGDLTALSNMPDLEVLSLMSMMVADQDIVKLKRCAKLSRIILVDTGLSARCLQGLVGSKDSMQRLELNRMRFDDDSFNNIAGCSHLTSLVIRDCQLSNIDPRKIEQLRHLELLDLTGSELPDQFCASIARIDALRTLRLHGTRLSSTELKSVVAVKGLKALDLSGNRLTDTDIAHLREIKGLEALNLSGTLITDASLDHIATLQKLKRLLVYDCDISADIWAKRLPHCRITARVEPIQFEFKLDLD
jgi:hypothetical protein